MTRLNRSELLVGFQPLYVDAKFDTEVATYGGGGGDGGNARGWVPAAGVNYVHTAYHLILSSAWQLVPTWAWVSITVVPGQDVTMSQKLS